MPKPEEISRYCSSLVVIVTGGHDEEEIQLAHFSVKEYLISNRVDEDIAQYFDETAARGLIAEVCLAYLLELDGNLPPQEMIRFYPMASYSARYWTSHSAIAESCNETVCILETEFFSERSGYESCYVLYNPDMPCEHKPWEHYVQRRRGLLPALYYA